MLPSMLLAMAVCAGAQEPVADLIRRLGSESFSQREQASQALDRLGPAALPALQQATESPDPEVRRRATALRRAIEERRGTAAALQPRIVRFRFANMPLPQALQEIERQTGLKVELSRPTELTERTVTLDTGAVPFWQAWQAFCRQARVADVLDPQQRRRLVAAEVHGPAEDVRGPFRVRIGTHDEVRGDFRVEISPEPGVQIEAIQDVRFTRLTGPSGKTYMPPAPTDTPEPARALPAPVKLPEAPRAVSVHLLSPPVAHGEKRFDIEGQFRARVRLPQPLVVVDAVVRAVGKTSAGAGGLRLKVLEAKLAEDGDLTLRLRLEGLDALPPPAPGSEVVRVRPGVVALRGPADVALDLLELWDAQGRKVPRIQASAEPVADGQAELRLTFQPRPGTEDELRLVLAAHRVITLTVPFLARDVPVP